MVKQKGHKVVVALTRATKDKQFKALQQEMGLLFDKDGEELALSTPQNTATWRPVVQSLQQHEGGTPGKQADQVDPDPFSLVPIPTSPPPFALVIRTFHWVGGSGHKECQVACISFSVWLSIHQIPSPQAKKRWSVWELGAMLPASLQDIGLRFSGNGGGKLVLAGSCCIAQVRTKMRAQHAAAASAGSIKISSIWCVVDFTLCYTMPNVIPLQVQDP
jgi:hypothetical protein